MTMPNKDTFEKHIDITELDLTAVDCLAATTPLSKQVIKQAMTKGAVWLSRNNHTQRLRRASRKLNIKDSLHFYYNPDLLATKPAKAILIADETDYSVWFKPCGLLSQGSKWSDHCTISRWASQHLKPERSAFIVHRLDRAATGLIIIAHTKTATTALTRLFQQREISKNYEAIVHGEFPVVPEVTTFETPIDDKPAISHVRLIQYSEKMNYSLVNIDIETGRKHQIRKHLSQAGFAIVGDRLYGNEQVFKTDLQLTAVSLRFICPLNDTPRHYRLDSNLRPQL